jgi:hypothetical protein
VERSPEPKSRNRGNPLSNSNSIGKQHNTRQRNDPRNETPIPREKKKAGVTAYSATPGKKVQQKGGKQRETTTPQFN